MDHYLGDNILKWHFTVHIILWKKVFLLPMLQFDYSMDNILERATSGWVELATDLTTR